MNNYLIESSELIEYALLDKKFLSNFDLEKTEENVMQIMSNFFKAQYKFMKVLPPRMTSNYEVKFESHSSLRASDCLGNYVETKLDSEQEIMKFYHVMADTIMRMNIAEKVYYTEFLLNSRSERFTAERIGVSRNGIIPIKNSCIVKIALAFGKEVEKNR